MFYIILILSIPVTTFLTWKAMEWLYENDPVSRDIAEWTKVRAALKYPTPYSSNTFNWCGQPVRMVYTINNGLMELKIYSI